MNMVKCESCNGTGRVYKKEGDHIVIADCHVCVGRMGGHKWRRNLKRKQEIMRKKLKEKGLIK